MTRGAGGGWRRRPIIAFERLMGVMNAVGTAWIFVLMVLINADVIGREAFAAPVRGVSEIVSLSIVGIVFMQLAHTLWVGRFTRSDAFLTRIQARWPRFAGGLETVYCLTGAILFAILFWASLPFFTRAVDIGEYVGALGDFTAPTWPVRLIILLGAAVTSVAFLILAAGHLKIALRGRETAG
ncbi:TRAP transporter small permease subunit [Oceanibacterium hippocampi]|uniref:TRAP transporter small permease protein n=1 Tax=Oceanibacterium hippocampi TaxID=745714 RepID=A0A1Y5U0Y4_9PROT|nr:TRAP transporter small permease subunit [Oceanibacterium hippocampi]SLN76319.1 Tripartite ATP-independent periplasmic transporters, DctQ component [Oceanibacterium hippocampi]